MGNTKYQDDDDTPLQKVLQMLEIDDDGRSKAGEWTKQLVPHLKPIAVTSDWPHPSASFAFTCQDEHCNRLDNLHGGAAATLFDLCTTMALVGVSKPGFWQFYGVTRSLNVTYFRPVPKGEEVIIECEVLQVGKRLATLKGVMRRKKDGQICCIAEHLKANIDPEPKV